MKRHLKPRGNQSKEGTGKKFASLKPVKAAVRKKGLGTASGGSRKLLLSALTAAATLSVGLIFFLRRESPRAGAFRSPLEPLDSPKITDLPQFKGAYDESMLWGTYRSNLYLGIRMRRPQSLLAGLMWRSENGQLRHTCEEGDQLARYGWVRHDGMSYGRQEIEDGPLVLETSFLKTQSEQSGFGGEWAVRISTRWGGERSYCGGRRRAVCGGHVCGARHLAASFICFGTGGGPHRLTAVSTAEHRTDSCAVMGAVMIQDAGGGVSWQGLRATHVHTLTQLIQGQLAPNEVSGSDSLRGSVAPGSNLAAVMVTLPVPGRWELVFLSGGGGDKARQRADELRGVHLDARLAEAEAKFDKRFRDTFALNAEEMRAIEGAEEAGKAALSNLLGGMGYFYGRSRIATPSEAQNPGDHPYALYWPAALYTAVPSRSFFPRGFLWDEGFHQLVISEQRVAVRKEALHLSLLCGMAAEMAQRVASGVGDPKQLAADKVFLAASWQRLEAWFRWFNTTQAGVLPGSFFWHGRRADSDTELNPKTLTSGLDDFPRASHPGPTERHLDLRCWMSLAAQSMTEITQILGISGQVYRATAARLADVAELNKLHLHVSTGRYYDFGNHTEKVRLVNLAEEVVDSRSGGVYYRNRVARSVSGRGPKQRMVPHFGYNSLFPLVLKMLPAQDEGGSLGRQLDLLRDPTLLWTDFGLRSLATTSSLYMARNTEHDPPYWRGPVWINFNFLALGALQHYANVPGPHQLRSRQIYTELRHNVMRNIVREYYRTGYLWEQYDNMHKGAGKGSHPFTGWTSLVVLIMAEMY